MTHPQPSTVIVNGVYENGHIRLLEPLDIPERTPVAVQPVTANQVITTVLGDWIIPSDPDHKTISDSQAEHVLMMLRERLSGVSLSQLVIDERQERS